MSKEAVKAAALSLFQRLSYVKTSVSDIAAASGIGKGSVYLAFRSKDEILMALLDDRLTEVSQECHAVFCNPQLPLEEKLDLFVQTLIEQHFYIRDLMFGSFDNVEGRELMDVYTKFSAYIDRAAAVLADVLAPYGYRTGERLTGQLKEFILSVSGRVVICILSSDWNSRDEVHRLLPSWARRVFGALVEKE